jgi:hypothetical protein
MDIIGRCYRDGHQFSPLLTIPNQYDDDFFKSQLEGLINRKMVDIVVSLVSPHAADVHVSPAMHQTTVAPTLLHRPYHTSLKYWTLRSLHSASFRRSWMSKSCGHGRQGQRGMERPSLLGRNRVFNVFSFVVVDDHSLANRINAAPTSVGVLQSAC